ncbi:MAG: serpin family protein [Saprospiraceae bacterium]|nr:serpin family protein [Saprospiraceae bacterium]
MNTKYILLLAMLCLIAFHAQVSKCQPTIPIFSCADHPSACEIAAVNGLFALDLFKQVNREEPADNNIFISPFSISTALTMTANGASRQTLADMLNTLKFSDMDMDSINACYKTLLKTLPSLDPATKLKIANSIWPQAGGTVQPAFLKTNSNNFSSEIVPVDFRHSAAVVEQVNGWIEDKTEGLIKQALGELPDGMEMLLINAIYFKGAWKVQFDPKNTHKANFQTTKGLQEVDMMHVPLATFPYFSNEVFQAVDLPYGNGNFSMSIFLPNIGHDVEEVIANMDSSTWKTWLPAFQPQELRLFMPKFKLEYGTMLRETLSGMGMASAFSPGANFTNMIKTGTCIGDVLHKAFVEVNEEGTEAAAVTIVLMVTDSAKEEDPIPTVYVNRPFVFVIRDNKTNSILFIGKVMNPQA